MKDEVSWVVRWGVDRRKVVGVGCHLAIEGKYPSMEFLGGLTVSWRMISLEQQASVRT